MLKNQKKLAILGLSIIATLSIVSFATEKAGTQQDPIISESFLNQKLGEISQKIGNEVTRLEGLIKGNTGGSGGLNQQEVNILLHFSGMNPLNKYAATLKENTPIKEQPNSSSKTLTTTPYYAGVVPLDAKDGFIKVKYYTTVGWIDYKELKPFFLK